MIGKAMYGLAVAARGESSVFRRLDSLRALQAASEAEILDVQRELLANTLTLAATRVPYYRGLTSGGAVHSQDALDLLRSLPILEKEQLQEDVVALRAENWKGRFTAKTTGGSTGRPVTVHKNPEAIAQEMAATWLGLGWFGIHIGDRCVRFWGQPKRNLRRQMRYRAADLAVSRKTLSAFGYTRVDLRSYLQTIDRFRPAFLYGYVSALEDLARFMILEGMRPSGPYLKAVITTSEVLTAPQRTVLEQAFGVPVQNEYGCGEVGAIAYECPAGSLHLLPTNQYIEIVDSDGASVPAGEAGYIVVTDLTNQMMPLVRYRVGDIGRLGPACGCGRGFPTLAEVYGREYDFVDAPDGRRFHGEFFMYIFEDLRRLHPRLGQFQIVQTGGTSLLVKVVLSDADAWESSENAIRVELKSRLPDFECTIERVIDLPRRPSGKMRVVENQMRERTRVD